MLGILHILTNAVKTKDPSTCLREIQSLVDDIQKKWESTLCIILLATPRTDDVKHHTNGQIINAMLRQSFSESSNIFLVDHSNMCNSGMPVAEFLAEDGFHLSERGTSQLAGNIKEQSTLHFRFHFHIERYDRSRSRNRRGRGRRY